MSLSGFKSYPLEGDGVVENLFYYLWCKDELDNGPKINIPDTIIYKFRQPAVWYFTAMDGQVKKKSKGNLVNVKIEEAFTRNQMGCDIVAYHLATNEEDGRTTIEYFNKHTFHDFLYNREKDNNGVVQRFIEPKGTRNSLIRAIWSPKVCLLERRINIRNLQDRKYGMYERAVTYEGADFNSDTAPVRGSILPSMVQHLCSDVVNHVTEVSFSKHKISRMAVNLKVDPNDRIWLLWASSIRVDRHPNMDKRVGRVRSTHVPQAPVNIDSLVSLPANVKLSAVPQPAGTAACSDDSVQTSLCLSCGRTVQPSRKHQLLYKSIVLHFEQLLTVLGVRAKAGSGAGSLVGLGPAAPPLQLQWPPHPDVVAALGGVGLGGYYGPLGPHVKEKEKKEKKKKKKKRRSQKKHDGDVGGADEGEGDEEEEDDDEGPTPEDLEIPPVLRLLHPQLVLHDYRTYRNDPLFLYKTTSVCEDCFLVYAETASAHLEPASVSSAVLTQHTGLHHPLEHADRRRFFQTRKLSPLSSRSGRRRGRRTGGHGDGDTGTAGSYGDPFWDERRAGAGGRRGGAGKAGRTGRKGGGGGAADRSGGADFEEPSTLMSAITQVSAPSFPRRIALDEATALRTAVEGPGGDDEWGPPSRGGGTAGSMGLAGRPPSSAVPEPAVPEPFKQTLQEREDSFFRDLYQNPNLQKGHPLTHLVTGAAKLEEHKEEMRRYQRSLNREFGGGGSSMGASQSTPLLHMPSAAARGGAVGVASTGALHGGELGGEALDKPSPYGVLQHMSRRELEAEKVIRHRQRRLSQIQYGSSSAGGSMAGMGGMGHGGLSTAGSSTGFGGAGGMGGMAEGISELSRSAVTESAASHREFLLQTLHGVRTQLSDPPPLASSKLEYDAASIGSAGGSAVVGPR